VETTFERHHTNHVETFAESKLNGNRHPVKVILSRCRRSRDAVIIDSSISRDPTVLNLFLLLAQQRSPPSTPPSKRSSVVSSCILLPNFDWCLSGICVISLKDCISRSRHHFTVVRILINAELNHASVCRSSKMCALGCMREELDRKFSQWRSESRVKTTTGCCERRSRMPQQQQSRESTQ
jgi:hypothetical protein